MDISIKLSGGLYLRGIISSPGENLKGVVIIVHGIGEHTGRYEHWIKNFNNAGFAALGLDLPGHGRSDGKRGHISSYAVTDEMIDRLISEYRKTFPGVPVFLYGHSLGGGIVLDYLLRKKPSITGAVVTSPFLKLAFQPDKFKLKLAAVMKNILPSLIQPTGLVVEYISHDPAIVEAYKKDPLVHGKISVSLFHSAMSAAENSLNNAGTLKTKILLLHGSDDKLTSPDGSREFASKTEKATLRIWEDGYHELHNEPFKEQVFSFISGWMLGII